MTAVAPKDSFLGGQGEGTSVDPQAPSELQYGEAECLCRQRSSETSSLAPSTTYHVDVLELVPTSPSFVVSLSHELRCTKCFVLIGCCPGSYSVSSARGGQRTRSPHSRIRPEVPRGRRAARPCWWRDFPPAPCLLRFSLSPLASGL